MMDDLIKKLQEMHGISEQKAKEILGTVSDHIREQYPSLKEKLGSFLSSDTVSSLKDKAADVENKLAGEAKELGSKITDAAKSFLKK